MVYLPITIITILLIIMGISLFKGKGYWLIAGYNTMSKSEKEKYDIKKLGRFVGTILILVALCPIIIGIGAFLNNNYILIIGIISIFVIAIFAIIYANVGKKFMKK